MDDAALKAPVLERSNVGMGMLVLNRRDGLDLPTINSAYTRLRDLEVNSLKRFVGLTASEPGPFCLGIDPKELLLAATVGGRLGRLPPFSRALLWHHQELAHLVADYRKPLVVHLGGLARNSGAALGCLANFSGAYEESEVRVDACFRGLVPDGGMTYVLARLDWHLGEFLALTGWPVRGVDLVYTGLVQHWLSPDALPFLELTSEKQLEVSESDARGLLLDHSLPLPDGLLGGEGDSLHKDFVPVIDEAFSQQTVSKIKKSLLIVAEDASKDMHLREFAKRCVERMQTAEPLALHATLRLIREAKQVVPRTPRTPEARWKELSAPGAHGEQGGLARALGLELRVQQRLLCGPRSQDATVGLHAACLGRAPDRQTWSRQGVDNVALDEVDDLLADESGFEAEFAVAQRPEFSLSRHPRLRRYHPDYNPVTGLDHDPEWMAAEVRRWSPDLFQDQRRQAVEELLGGRDPAAYGLSRWVRVEGRA